IESKSIGIAYTYNEPTIWYEFVFDCAERFHDKKLKNVLVTNGYINKKPLEEIVNFIDAANVDLKGFTEDKYRLLGGSLKPVLNTIEFLINKGVHVEITHLAVPNYTSDYDDFRELCKWLSNLNRDIPIHISRYFPTYKLNLPPTSIDFLEHLYEIAKSCLSYVYLGNIPYKNDSYCPYCGAVLVKRMGYSVECFMGDSRCPYCGKDLYFLL
ncbi:MAG: radical SAM protein, partial [Deferribacterales bacterium]